MSDDIETLRKFICEAERYGRMNGREALAALERVEKEAVDLHTSWTASAANRDSLRAKIERAKAWLRREACDCETDCFSGASTLDRCFKGRAHAVLSELSADAPAESLDEKCERLKSQHETAKSRDACRRLSADAPAQQTPSKPFDEWTDAETLAELEKLAPVQQTQISDEVREALVEAEKALSAFNGLITVKNCTCHECSRVRAAQVAHAKLRSVMK